MVREFVYLIGVVNAFEVGHIVEVEIVLGYERADDFHDQNLPEFSALKRADAEFLHYRQNNRGLR